MRERKHINHARPLWLPCNNMCLTGVRRVLGRNPSPRYPNNRIEHPPGILIIEYKFFIFHSSSEYTCDARSECTRQTFKITYSYMSCFDIFSTWRYLVGDVCDSDFSLWQRFSIERSDRGLTSNSIDLIDVQLWCVRRIFDRFQVYAGRCSLIASFSSRRLCMIKLSLTNCK